MKAPLTRGNKNRAIVIKIRMKQTAKSKGSGRYHSKITNINGARIWPEINIVIYAGPSSAL